MSEVPAAVIFLEQPIGLEIGKDHELRDIETFSVRPPKPHLELVILHRTDRVLYPLETRRKSTALCQDLASNGKVRTDKTDLTTVRCVERKVTMIDQGQRPPVLGCQPPWWCRGPAWQHFAANPRCFWVLVEDSLDRRHPVRGYSYVIVRECH